MGYWYRSLLAILICTIFAGVVIAQDDSNDLPSEGNIVVVDSAFVRSGPSNDYIAVGALFEGDEVFPQNISEDGQWVLIPYSRGSGWVQRNLVRWEDEAQINQLPVLAANITPTPRIAITNTPFIPTATPEGNYINLSGAASAYVRAGPGRGYLRLGQLLPGDTIEALARNDDTSWVMIRFSNEPLVDGFAWLATDLVNWVNFDELLDLPIIDPDNLTPTVTFTPSQTASATATATNTSTATNTPTDTNTPEPTATPTYTETPEPSATSTVTPSATVTPEPTITNTATFTVTSTDTTAPTETNSPEPSETPTETVTFTPEPSATASVTNSPEPSATATETATSTPEPTATPTVTLSPTPSETATATNSPEPSETPTETVTFTPEPTATETVTISPTPSETATATVTSTEIVAAALAASETSEPSPSITASATSSPTQTETVTATEAITDIFSVQETSVAVESTSNALSITSEPPDPNILELAPDNANQNIPVEAIVGIGILLIVLAYIWFYWQGLAASGRYANGFVIDDCPVCRRGHLEVEERQSRIFGIPSMRRTVRCDTCRSVLRETGTQRWRYAVDRIENAAMYDRFNGREVSDTDLERLGKTPTSASQARTSPEFLENDPEE